jgi:aquaporin Z
MTMAAKKTKPEATDFHVDLETDTWAASEVPPPGLLARLSAELLGTFAFMFVGLGTAFFIVALSTTSALKSSQDVPGIMAGFTGFNYATTLTATLAWAVTLLALVVAFGRTSGAHFNPAVTIGTWVAGRFPGRDVALYLIVQVAGAIGATSLIWWFAGGLPIFTANDPLLTTSGLTAPTVGQGMSTIAIGSGDHSPTGIALSYGLVIEFIATALLVGAFLAATSVKAPKGQAPFTIGLSLGVLILLAGPFTGGALNPARATATALFATDAEGSHWALGQLWWWWVATIVAGAFIGLLVRAFGPEEDLDVIEAPKD